MISGQLSLGVAARFFCFGVKMAQMRRGGVLQKHSMCGILKVP
uniref:Uncharacterized protein n=1 Tax=Ackermannviridae sp. TaxID=2831612 RepID=A0A8S5RTJ1_9CAUD|nr:MAG TPA: hypothetical protein [Ackermannviridae sp.]